MSFHDTVAGGTVRGARRTPWVAAALLLVCVTGCELLQRRVPPEEPPPPAEEESSDPTIRGTIGAITRLGSEELEPMRGFGVVVGLNGRGSGDCPTVIREYLIDYFAKQVGPLLPQDRRPTPAGLIDSLDTAVVEIRGVVPMGARANTRFDLQVEALTGTATQSLEGGLLLAAPLRYFEEAASGRGLIEGRVLAESSGPVFVNPFPEGEDGNLDPRRGLILGGGRTTAARVTRLLLLQPDYQLAQRVERRINERFGPRPRVAEATSAGVIEMRTPPQYARDPQRFIQLVQQLYVDNRTAFVDAQAAEIVRQVLARQVDVDRAALTLEAIGRTVVPRLQPLYGQNDPRVRFLAARTGLRLEDLSALPVLAELARTGPDELRVPAIEELGTNASPQVGLQLTPLLDEADPLIRIAAYEVLLQRAHPAVRSTPFALWLDRGQINFSLDIVESNGPPLIYARRTRLPRLAIFGPGVPVVAPVFYSNSDDSVTVFTRDNAPDVRVFTRRRNRMSEQLILPPRAAELARVLGDLPVLDDNRRPRGLGLPYSRALEVLADLCNSGTIPAEMVLEFSPLAEQLGRGAGPLGRPPGARPEGVRRDVVPPVPAAEPAPRPRPETEDERLIRTSEQQALP